MKKILLFVFAMSCLSSFSQKYPATYFVAGSLLSNDPFQHMDTSSQLTTGILWDRAHPNFYLPAYQNTLKKHPYLHQMKPYQ